MSFRRVQQGDWLRLAVLTEDSSGNAAWPTDVSGATVYPYLTILDISQTHTLVVMADQPIAATNRFDSNVLGWHDLWQRIGPEFPVGVYHVYYQWQAASANPNRFRTESFEVVPGGDAKGAYSAIGFYDKPQATFILGQTDGGLLEARRNPT